MASGPQSLRVIDHSFDIFCLIVRLTNTDKPKHIKPGSYHTMPMAKKKDGEVRCFGDHVASCFTTTEASIYVHKSSNNVLQLFCAVAIGE